MSLADQIIDHEPWQPDELAEFHCTGAEANALRDELLELRQLRQAAEARRRFSVDTLIGGEDEPDSVALYCTNCRWDVYPDAPVPLAELVRRAAEHGEECR